MIELMQAIAIIIAACLLPYVIRALFQVFDFLIVSIPVYSRCKNPLVDDSNVDRYNEYLCLKHGCITTASYYVGMPQATCCRCGGRNWCAAKHVEEWRLPDRYRK